eukprot:jgi/Ulvmu1/1917/UM012_0077.1
MAAMLPMKRASGFAGDMIGHQPGLFSTISTNPSRRLRLFSLLPWVLLLMATYLLLSNRHQTSVGVSPTHLDTRAVTSSRGNIFVSYSYFEKDGIQKANFDFFILSAMGIHSVAGQDMQADYFIVVNGDVCTPCKAFDQLLSPQSPSPMEGIAWVRRAPGVTMLKRIENEGMDFAAHNTTMTYAMDVLQTFWTKYRYFLFLNSSIKGPFTPKYYPFHWSEPYLSRINANTKAIGSSIVCLPEVDAGGPGPKLESWAFAIDAEGLKVVLARGVFHLHLCKLCDDGVVVMGEYGITTALFEAGYTIDTLMAKYGNVDWHDRANWNCNDQVHPSRHGTYDGISMNPYEVVFLKASWHVGEPFADKYATWQTRILRGQRSTSGAFDEPMYRFAVQPEAQEKHAFIERAYQVGPRVPPDV